LKNPKRFGWRLDLPEVPEPEYFTHHLPCNDAQRAEARKILAGPGNAPTLFVSRETNAIERAKLAQVARGFRYRKADGGKGRVARPVGSAKPPFVADLAASEVADGHQVLLWTTFDEESSILARLLADGNRGHVPFALLTGRTKDADRINILDRFREGEIRCLISRPKMLGYGLNFQHCTSMIFSGFSESFEDLYQAIRRAVRHGQMERVRVHFPFIEELEGETFANLMRKSADHERSTAEMEDNYLKSYLALQGKAVA
jgi:SNF2 family DNA or RNA helicase